MRSGIIAKVVSASAVVIGLGAACYRRQGPASSPDAEPVGRAPVFPDGISGIAVQDTGWPEKVWLELSPNGVCSSDGAKVVSHEAAVIQALLTGTWARIDPDAGVVRACTGHVNDVSFSRPEELSFDSEWQMVEDGNRQWDYRIWFNMAGGYYSIYQDGTAPHCDDPPLLDRIAVERVMTPKADRGERILRVQSRDGTSAAFRWVGSPRKHEKGKTTTADCRPSEIEAPPAAASASRR